MVCRMKGAAFVEGTLVAEAELSSILVDRDPTGPTVAPLMV